LRQIGDLTVHSEKMVTFPCLTTRRPEQLAQI